VSRSIVISAPASADLERAPISSDWILSGTPEARNRLLAKSHDRTSSVIVWECTAGCFNWHYSEDQTVVVMSGEVFITIESDEERRLGQGDMGFFLPALPAHGVSLIASRRLRSFGKTC
jgi:uncharacterized protein